MLIKLTRSSIFRSSVLIYYKAVASFLFFPEGTESLGPKHLPLRVELPDCLMNIWLKVSLVQVIPLGIHYQSAWTFRSQVEVVVGEAISIDLDKMESSKERVKELKRRINLALEKVGIDVNTLSEMEMIERIASIAVLGTKHSYFQRLKSLEKSVPQKLIKGFRELEPELAKRKLFYYQGVPLYPLKSFWIDLLALFCFGPLVLVAIAINFLPFFLAAWAGRKFPNERNVISLWRIFCRDAFIFDLDCRLECYYHHDFSLDLGNPLWRNYLVWSSIV
ncbi:MAG: hypothetical protein R3F23_04240 [Verrucomicrobiia bacterium]